MAKQKVNLNHLAASPAQNMDEMLLGTPAPAPVAHDKPAAEAAEEKIRFTNALPPQTFRRLQQYTFWSHETLGDVLDEALTAFLANKPEADRTIPAKQAARRRIP